MAYENNNKKFDNKDNAKKSFNSNRPRNLHTSIYKYVVVNAAKTAPTSEENVSAVMEILQSITYDLISIPVTLKTTDENGKVRVNKVGFVNGFEAHLEDEEFKVTILSNFVNTYKKLNTPCIKILVRTDKKTGDPVQVLGFEIAEAE